MGTVRDGVFMPSLTCLNIVYLSVILKCLFQVFSRINPFIQELLQIFIYFGFFRSIVFVIFCFCSLICSRIFTIVIFDSVDYQMLKHMNSVNVI